MYATVGTIESVLGRDQKVQLLESGVMQTRIWAQYFVTSKYFDYMQYYVMLPEQRGKQLAKYVATGTSLDDVQFLVCLVT